MSLKLVSDEYQRQIKCYEWCYNELVFFNLIRYNNLRDLVDTVVLLDITLDVKLQWDPQITITKLSK